MDQQQTDASPAFEQSRSTDGLGDSKRVPSFQELMNAPHAVFRGWCQGPMAYACGDLLAAAAVCRLDNARAIMQSVVAEAGHELSAETLEHIQRFTDA